MFRLAVILASVGGAVIAAMGLPVYAQPAGSLCGSRTAIVRQLEQNYAEKAVAIGLASSGAVVEVFASRVGTWTIMLTTPTGMACVVATGKSWEMLSTVRPGDLAL